MVSGHSAQVLLNAVGAHSSGSSTMNALLLKSGAVAGVSATQNCVELFPSGIAREELADRSTDDVVDGCLGEQWRTYGWQCPRPRSALAGSSS